MNNRNANVDLLRLFCCVLVVLLHKGDNFEHYNFIASFSRVAVPLFFMITGFYYDEIVEKNKEKKQISKIVKMIVFANLVYVFYYLLNNNGNYLIDRINIEELLKLVLFNQNPIEGSLWYLNAMLYLLMFVYLLNKLNILEPVLKVSFIFLILYLIFGSSYSLLIVGREFSACYHRNFLLTGLPFFSFGYFNKKKIISFNKQSSLITAFIFSVALLIIECCVLNKHGIDYQYNEMFISTPILCISIFEIFNSIKVKHTLFSILAKIGQKHSANIYMFANLISSVIKPIIIKNEFLYKNFRPLLVFVFSLLFSIFINRIKKICFLRKNV